MEKDISQSSKNKPHNLNKKRITGLFPSETQMLKYPIKTHKQNPNRHQKDDPT